jgi:hypothetical protein
VSTGWSILATLAVIALMMGYLRSQGRPWWCTCGSLALWSGDIWSSHNSQHLFDPYSFTHVLHGLLFFGLLQWLCPRLPLGWRLCIAVIIEAGWEALENSKFVINRYRTATISLDYFGDAVLNSVGDILSCIFGFFLARFLGFWQSVIFFILVEALLVASIRDSLLLSVIMLVHPFDAIKEWQMP